MHINEMDYVLWKYCNDSHKINSVLNNEMCISINTSSNSTHGRNKGLFYEEWRIVLLFHIIISADQS